MGCRNDGVSVSACDSGWAMALLVSLAGGARLWPSGGHMP